MPERVVLTPLPDNEIKEIAVDVLKHNMKVETITCCAGTMDGAEAVSMDPHEFSIHFSLRFMTRLFQWRTRATRPSRRKHLDWGHAVPQKT